MKLSSKSRYAVMALTDLAKFNNKDPVTLRDIGLLGSNLAMSAKAITAYLPLLDNFIFCLFLLALYIYPTKIVKFQVHFKTCILSLNFDRKI